MKLTLALLAAASALPLLGPAPAPAPAAANAPQIRTLYQLGFTQNAISLATGEFGTGIVDGQVFNFDSELVYGTYDAAQFSAGIQGGQVGELLDLGTTDEVAARYGYSETVGGGQGFASIAFTGGRLRILDDDAIQGAQPFTEGQAFFDAAPPADSTSQPAELDHLYLVRVLDDNDPEFERLAKLYVMAHDPGVSVTFIWEELER